MFKLPTLVVLVSAAFLVTNKARAYSLCMSQQESYGSASNMVYKSPYCAAYFTTDDNETAEKAIPTETYSGSGFGEPTCSGSLYGDDNPFIKNEMTVRKGSIAQWETDSGAVYACYIDPTRFDTGTTTTGYICCTAN